MESLLIQRLKAYLENTPEEQKRKDWEAVKSLHLTGGPTVQEFIASFKHTPTYRPSVIVSIAPQQSNTLDFASDKNQAQLAMAA